MTRRLLIAPLLVVLLVGACGGESASPSGAGRTAAPAPTQGTKAATPAPVDAGAGASDEFEPIVLKGKGDKDVKFEIPEDAIAIAAMSHPGSGGFQVQAYGEDGTVSQTLVKANGKYSGVVLFDLVDHSVGFKVSAKGPWKITVQPTDAGKEWDGTGSLKGKGDAIVHLTNLSAAGAKLDVRSSGKARFMLRAHSTDDEVWLVDQAGPVKSRIELPEDTQLLEIRAKGNWTLKAVS